MTDVTAYRLTGQQLVLVAFKLIDTSYAPVNTNPARWPASAVRATSPVKTHCLTSWHLGMRCTRRRYLASPAPPASSA
jgi:hypothetical protein